MKLQSLVIINAIFLSALLFLLGSNLQPNTSAVFAQTSNNTTSPSSIATSPSSDEETGVSISPLSSLHANDTLLSTARLSTAMSHSSNNCDQSLWDHVYHPFRLQVNDPCMTVTGTIVKIKAEKDGDLHIRVNLDPEFNNLLNDANLAGEGGDLVVEPICQGPVTQPDAIASCQDFHQDINIPSVGTHVSITGDYVLDAQHGWMEIHPVTSIQPSE
jgi:hypothetical protein